jgi:phage tail-like protein
MGVFGSFSASVSANVDVGAELDVSASVDIGASIDIGASAGVTMPAMGLGGRRDPYLSYNFAVEIEGLVVGGFSEVSGLQSEIEVQDYREGGLNQYVHRRAGPTKYPANLVLKKGVTDVRTMWNWYYSVAQGSIQRKNLSVLLLDSTGQEKLRWNFEQAYPVKWVGPDLRGTSSEVAVESVELAHCGFAAG